MTEEGLVSGASFHILFYFLVSSDVLLMFNKWSTLGPDMFVIFKRFLLINSVVSSTSFRDVSLHFHFCLERNIYLILVLYIIIKSFEENISDAVEVQSLSS